jgi:hypothetical protein
VTISDQTDANSFAVAIGTGSSLNVNNSMITHNTGGGISLFNNSALNLTNFTVSNNQGSQFGAALSLNSNCSANLINVQISGHLNTDPAVAIGQNSSFVAFTQTGPSLMVTSNGHRGISVDDSHISFQNATITGNGGTDLSAFFGSRLSLNAGNVIGTCAPHDASVLIRGSTSNLCP